MKKFILSIILCCLVLVPVKAFSEEILFIWNGPEVESFNIYFNEILVGQVLGTERKFEGIIEVPEGFYEVTIVPVYSDGERVSARSNPYEWYVVLNRPIIIKVL